MKRKRTLEEKILDKVAKNKNNGCWEWTGATDKDGYGRYCFKLVHRMIYKWLCCDLITKRCVCHSCDNPKCCNPVHLFHGSDADNARDKIQKKRDASGERHGNTKLTEEMVRQIRSDLSNGMTQKQVARKYGLHRGNVSHIWRRVSWAHVA